jgi:hypothetical protein
MNTKPLRPCFKLVAIAEDEATKEFVAIIKFRDRDGGMRRVDLPLADLDNRKALTKTLTNLGAYFSDMEAKNKGALDKLLAAKRKAKRINFAARVGWYGSGYKAGLIWLRPETELPISSIASRRRCLKPNEQNGLKSDAE